MVPKILKSTLFIVNCSDCLSAEFVGHASTPYTKTGRHLDLIKANKTSSDALRPIFPKRLLKAMIVELRFV